MEKETFDTYEMMLLKFLHEELEDEMVKRKLTVSKLAKKAPFHTSNLCRDRAAERNHKLITMHRKATAAGIKLSVLLARAERKLEKWMDGGNKDERL